MQLGKETKKTMIQGVLSRYLYSNSAPQDIRLPFHSYSFFIFARLNGCGSADNCLEIQVAITVLHVWPLTDFSNKYTACQASTKCTRPTISAATPPPFVSLRRNQFQDWAEFLSPFWPRGPLDDLSNMLGSAGLAGWNRSAAEVPNERSIPA